MNVLKLDPSVLKCEIQRILTPHGLKTYRTMSAVKRELFYSGIVNRGSLFYIVTTAV